jgi:hypothetical protein
VNDHPERVGRSGTGSHQPYAYKDQERRHDEANHRRTDNEGLDAQGPAEIGFDTRLNIKSRPLVSNWCQIGPASSDIASPELRRIAGLSE